MNNPEKIETILYGGAFNPPTIAHQAILRACVEYAQPRGAEVWVVPSGSRSDKSISVSRQQRLAYIEAMIADLPLGDVTIETKTLELDRPMQIETYDTVQELEQLYPDRIMTWVFGSDSTETMGEWDNGQWLLDNLSMLVVERPGSQVNPLARHATKLVVEPTAISSTEVRRRLFEGRSVRDLVTPRVERLLA